MGRPLKLTSTTTRIEVACGCLTIIIAFHEKTNTPVECYIRPPKKAGCQSNISAVSDLTNFLLHEEGGLSKSIEALSGHFCSACRSKKEGKTQKEKREMPNSCPDAVMRVLKSWVEENHGSENKNK